MSAITIFLLAVGLSMDAFAVSVASGLGAKVLRVRHAIRLALFFGLFQAIMPLLGWYLGSILSGFISKVDHWVAFGLLSIIGVKMIYESFVIEKEERQCFPHGIYALLVLSVATSIDAFAVGITISVLNTPILVPAMIIGLITFCFCIAGVAIGKRFGQFFEGKVEIAGGIILIGLGVKILIEHL